ncbi:hypothetical protein WJX72_008351 [[Myrmecia] bisecta]|uniref:Uncharacterized protein n=1 Tax=[Myrmecia] bisecta TaxID=41462 RepID=A0AAW1R8H9_9CHLO
MLWTGWSTWWIDWDCLWCEPGFALFSWTWWIVGASIITHYVHQADNAHLPQRYWRHVVVGLAWGEVLLWSITLALTILQLVAFYRAIPEIPEGQVAAAVNRDKDAPGISPDYVPYPPGYVPYPPGYVPYPPGVVPGATPAAAV